MRQVRFNFMLARQNYDQHCPAFNVKLGINRVQMRFNCADADVELPRDYFVWMALTSQNGDLFLAFG